MIKSFVLMKAILLGAGGLALAASAVHAQDATMKNCAEAWQAAKAAGTTQGATWPQFLT